MKIKHLVELVAVQCRCRLTIGNRVSQNISAYLLSRINLLLVGHKISIQQKNSQLH